MSEQTVLPKVVKSSDKIWGSLSNELWIYDSRGA